MHRSRRFGLLAAAILLVLSAGPALAADPVIRIDRQADGGRVPVVGADVRPEGVASLEPQAFPGAKGKIVYSVAPEDAWPSHLWIMDSNGANKTEITAHSTGWGDNDAAWSPGGSLIAFARDMTASTTDGGEDIFTIRPDGTGLRRLTNTAADDWAPSFSPDGSRIAFTSDRHGNPEIYTMAIDGSDVRRLTKNEAYDDQADWSPVGATIVFISNLYNESYIDLFSIKPDGSGIRSITSTGTPSAPDWEPSGARYAFSTLSYTGVYDVYSVGVSTGRTYLETKGLSSPALRPSYGPDGVGFIVDTSRDIIAMHVSYNPVFLAQTLDDEWNADWQPIPTFPLVDAQFSTFKADIEWVFAEGITVGCSAERYCPNDAVTRGQMATFLVRALDLPSTTTDYFTDDETSSHEGNINRVRAAGITSGCSPTTYCPEALVTREQMATFLAKGFALPATTTDYFTDDETSSHESNINRVKAAGITSGCTPTTYCPTTEVTRGQMAAFLRRALD